MAPPAQAILDAMSDAVLVADPSSRLTYMNRAAEILTGWTAAEALGTPLARIIDVDEAAADGSRSCRLRDRHGVTRPAEAIATLLRDEAGALIGRVVVCRDIGPVVALSQALSHRADHDALTDLPNRRVLLERLDRALVEASTHGRPVAVGFLDVDGMKRVNDSRGHAAGDELLVAIATRLRMRVRGADTVSRLGGDEFVVLLSRVETAGDAERLMRTLMRSLTRPYRLSSGGVRVGVSAGLAWSPDHGRTAGDLLASADRAMYVAKHQRGDVAIAGA